jgi:hypothetical protein
MKLCYFLHNSACVQPSSEKYRERYHYKKYLLTDVITMTLTMMKTEYCLMIN